MVNFIKRRAPTVLAAVLVAQAAAFYGFSKGEHVPSERPLIDFHLPSAVWKPLRDEPLDQETSAALQADDTLSRVYENRTNGHAVQLFVAYFSTQRTGKTPHSPKNCLPGSGWVADESGTIAVNLPGKTNSITINRYLVSKEESQSLVLYWYQSHNRSVASEYRAKLFTILDSIRYRRSDTALIRVVEPVIGGDSASATREAVSFVESVLGPLRSYLPA